MKKVFGFLFVIIFILIGCKGCDVFPQPQSRPVRLIWTKNSEPDMRLYRVYFWQGNTKPVSVDSVMLTFAGTVNHTYTGPDSLVYTGYMLYSNYIAGGCIAVDSSGQWSKVAITKTYMYTEIFEPGRPNIRGIRKQ